MQSPFQINSRDFILQWNVMFPLDRLYRKKNGIAFGSPAHLEVSQVALYLDHLEEQMVSEYLEKAINEEKYQKEIAQGNFFKDESKEDEDALFEKAIANFNQVNTEE